jgi:hypothetical protein
LKQWEEYEKRASYDTSTEHTGTFIAKWKKKRTGLPIHGGILANTKEHSLPGFMPYLHQVDNQQISPNMHCKPPAPGRTEGALP